MRTYSGRPSSSMRFSTLTAMATSLACRPSVASAAVANHPFPARNVGFDESAPVVARGFLPSHAAVLGNDLNVPVALGCVVPAVWLGTAPERGGTITSASGCVS